MTLTIISLVLTLSPTLTISWRSVIILNGCFNLP
jgi:hypothetical protein